MAKLAASGYRFPEPAGDIQVNFSKNIRCTAFGVPETLHRVKRPRGTYAPPGDYIRVTSSEKTVMSCGVCGGRIPIRNNLTISEELAKLTLHTQHEPAPSCPHEDCDNFDSPTTEAGLYARFGKTKVGNQRCRCNNFRKTFSEEGAPLLRQRMAHKNRGVLVLLMNKVPTRGY